MANMEHVQIVRKGRDAVASWREENAGQVLDLNNCYMSHARIPMVDLHGSDLRDSDFMGAMLRRANLSGCFLNPAHMYRSDLREADLTRALLNGANLRGADLRGANLEGADLDAATLSDANLTGASLRRANLSRVNLNGANLTDADLTEANFNGAALNRTNLSGATLAATDFYEAVFNNTPTVGTKFDGAIIGYTVFQNCDLSEAIDLDKVRHDAPGTVGVDTVFRSHGKLPEAFVLGIGAPPELLSFLGTIDDSLDLGGEYYISCTQADVPFAQNLRDNLRSQGIRSWVFAENFRGNPLVDRRSTSEEEEIERWVRRYPAQWEWTLSSVLTESCPKPLCWVSALPPSCCHSWAPLMTRWTWAVNTISLAPRPTFPLPRTCGTTCVPRVSDPGCSQKTFGATL